MLSILDVNSQNSQDSSNESMGSTVVTDDTLHDIVTRIGVLASTCGVDMPTMLGMIEMQKPMQTTVGIQSTEVLNALKFRLERLLAVNFTHH